MRKNTKGFTLVELLAVIVIMGILMMVAIPAVSRTIENTRKDTFVNLAKQYAEAAINQWTADGFSCGGVTSSAVDVDKNYYILIDSKEGSTTPELLQQGGDSPWGSKPVTGYVKVLPTLSSTGNKVVTKFQIYLTDGVHYINENTEYDKVVRGYVNSNGNVKKLHDGSKPFAPNGKDELRDDQYVICVEQ